MNNIDAQQCFDLILEHASLAIFEMDPNGIIVKVNETGISLFASIANPKILHSDYLAVLQPDDPNRLRKCFERAKSGDAVTLEFTRQSDGKQFTQSLCLLPIRDAEKKIKCVMGLAQDTSALKQTEQMLFNAQKKYRSVIDNIPDTLIEMDPQGRMIFLNRVLEGYSLDQLIGQPIVDFLQDAEQKKLFLTALHAAKTSGQAQECELITGQTHWNSRITPIHENNVLHRLVMLNQDITEKKRIEKEKQLILEQLFQSQKLESLGKLAGGVAHEFNNLLAIILLHCAMLTPEAKKNTSMQQALSVIIKSAERAEELTKQLLGFARKGKYGAKLLHINPIIEEAANLLKTSIQQKNKITIKTNLANALPQIVGSESQILQCLMNLGLNAVDALPNGGNIRISAFLKTENNAENKNKQTYLCVEVKDDGEGIAEENLKKIFDPFFTTKDIGKGTGLGLSMVYGIMDNHGGRVDVVSQINQGATFTLLFPVTTDATQTREQL